MENILKKLQDLSESDFYPYHMPGHKRAGNPYFALDITEIDDFDNLHHATGMIREAQERAARIYGAVDSFFLVNGSTCGLLSAIFASFDRGDKVLVARNCHKAVYHGLEIRGLEPVYVYPEMENECDISVGMTAKQVKEVLNEADKRNDIKGMILTSPTYEGMVSEIKEIAELLHQKDMILIVDEAHGAHFGFHESFPPSAVTQGADLVIQSLHKTLPSMTQTALLHRCSDRVEVAKVQKYLGVFQTSSPSYVFMAYMDECIRLLEEHGRELFDAFIGRLEHFYKRCEKLEKICVMRPKLKDVGRQYLSDPGKIVISAGEFYSGRELHDILRNRFRLQPEMCCGGYVLAIMTICDEEKGFERLYEALTELDKELQGICGNRSISETSDAKNRVDLSDTKKTHLSLLKKRPVMRCTPAEAEACKEETVKLAEAVDRVSGEYIYLYPPGIPFIVPGEVLDKEAVEALLYLQKQGYELQGPADVSGMSLKVLL